MVVRWWLTVAIAVGASVAATAVYGSERGFLPTSISCPNKQSGVLELISTSADGARELLKVSFTNGNPVLVEIEAAEVGEAVFTPIFRQAPSESPGTETEIARNAAAFAGQFLTEFCLEADPAVKKQKWLQLKERKPSG